MAGVDYLNPAVSVLDSMSYGDLEGKFSRYYKIDTLMLSPPVTESGSDKPRFEYRIYSFGQQTGYKHPPLMYDDPFKDQWDSPAKDFIVFEETLIDKNDSRHFLSCGITHLEAADLMSVTADKFEFEVLGVNLYAEDSKGNRVWYSDGKSYGSQCLNDVTWKRFFIAPSSTQGNNGIFTRYDFIPLISTEKVNVQDLPSRINNLRVSQVPVPERGSLLAANVVGSSETTTDTAPAPKTTRDPLLNAYTKMAEKFPNGHYTYSGGLSLETANKLYQNQAPAVLQTVFKTIPSYSKLTAYYSAKQKGAIEDNPVYDKYMDDTNTYEKAIKDRLQAIEANPALIAEATTIRTENTNINGTTVSQKNNNGQPNINGVTPVTGPTNGLTSQPPVSPRSPIGTIWLICIIAFVLIIVSLFAIKIPKTRMMVVIILVILTVAGILMVLFYTGQYAETSVLGKARSGTRFSDLCSDNIEFNNYASIQSNMISPGKVIIPSKWADTVSLEFQGSISSNNKFVSLCQNNKIIAIIPTFKYAETDSGNAYKLTIDLIAVGGGMNVSKAEYVTGIDGRGNEIKKSMGTMCNVSCDLNNANKPFSEVEYLGPQAQGGVIGCFTKEVTESHQLLTGYDTNSIYATTKPQNDRLDRTGFTLMNFEPKSSIDYTVVEPPAPPPTPARSDQ